MTIVANGDDSQAVAIKIDWSRMRPTIDDRSIARALDRFRAANAATVSVSGLWLSGLLHGGMDFPVHSLDKHQEIWRAGAKYLYYNTESFVEVETAFLITVLEQVAAYRLANGISIPGFDWEAFRQRTGECDPNIVAESQGLQWDGLRVMVANIGMKNTSLMAEMPTRARPQVLSNVCDGIDGIYPVRTLYQERPVD
ncbi:MAG: hypothetical protein RSG77_21560 [Hafnia sp.]